MKLTELVTQIGPVALVATLSSEAEATVITLHGESDLYTLPVVVEVLARVVTDFDGPVVVDLAQTTFVDVGTVRALATTAARLAEGRRTFTLRSPSRMVRRILGVFDLTGLVMADHAAVA
jgi:anti-anti-sigma factor